MELFRRINGTMLRRGAFALLALFVFVVVMLELFGIPEYATSAICRCGTHFNTSFSMHNLHCGIFSGFSCRKFDLRLDTKAGPVHFTANEMKVRIAWKNLLFRHGHPIRELVFRDGTVVVYTPAWKDLYNLNVSGFSFSSDGGDEGRASVMAEFEGIRLRLTARLSGLEKIVYGDSDKPEEEHRTTQPDKQLCDSLAKFAARLNDFDFGIDDTTIAANAQIDINAPENLELTGSFNVGDAVMSGIMVSRLRGRIAMKDKFVKAEDVVWFSDKGVLRGHFSYSFDDKLLYSRGEGKVEPAMALKFLGSDFKGASVLKDMVVPWNVRWNIPEVRLDSSAIKLDMDCDFRDIDVSGIHLKEGGFSVEFLDDRISVNDLSITKGNHDHLKGRLAYDLKSKTMDCRIRGRCDTMALAQELGVEFNSELRRNSDMRVVFNLTMNESPLQFEKMDISGNVSLRSLRLDNWNLDDISAKLMLKDGVLSVLEGTFMFGNSETLPGKVECSVNISNLLDDDSKNDVIDIKHHIEISAKEKGTIEPCVEEDGNIIWRKANGTLKFNASGSAYGDRLYRSYLADSGINDIDMFSPFYCQGKPVAFKVEVPEFKVDDIGKVSLDGSLEGENCGFGSFAAKTASCGLHIDAERTVFKDIKGVTEEGYDACLNIEIQYSPFILTIKDLKFKGDPSVCESYVMASEANRIYKSIWEEIEWDKSSMPDINIPIICYSSGTSGESWNFKMETDMDVSKFKYKGIDVSEASVKMAINLPDDGVNLKPLSLTLGDTRLSGECHISTDNQNTLSFKVADASGSIDVKRTLARISPELCKEFDKLELEGIRTFFCDGSMYLNGPMDLRVSGNIDAGLFRLDNHEISDLGAKWFFENGKIRWDVKEASFLDGNVKTTGDYDIHSRQGDILLVANRLNWAKIIALASPDESAKNGESDNAKQDGKNNATGEDKKKEVPGYVDFECSTRFMKDWASRPLHLEGTGHFALREADLWNVPMMRGLESFLKRSTFNLFGSKDKDKTTFGQISALDTDVEFKGTRVVCPDISTNGTIIALSGSGEYSWEKDRLKAYISGEALKEISLVSILLKPFTWAFHVELTGTKEKSEWRMRTALSKFSD